jgi:hypothetical protein
MRYVLASWDSTGFECLQDITHFHPDNFDKQRIMEALRGNDVAKNPLYHQISMMKLRARFNSQRCYEIYVMATEDDIEFKDVEDWMIGDPQSLVNWIRVNHHVKVYSDYSPTDRRVIT